MNSLHFPALTRSGALVLAFWSSGLAAQSTIMSLWARADVPLDTTPESPFWRAAQAVHMEADPYGHPLLRYRTEVRARWTTQNLYFLFICPYDELNLKPNPKNSTETYKLWDWDVAEVFIGSDFKHIERYKEFEVSPQNEWVDLDIDLSKPHHEQGWVWNSGFEHCARIDPAKHVWYAALRIPFVALSQSAALVGTTFRINLFRTEGSPHQGKEIMWQPTQSSTFHVPERFGLLRLAGD